jgi:hypothetical protein
MRLSSGLNINNFQVDVKVKIPEYMQDSAHAFFQTCLEWYIRAKSVEIPAMFQHGKKHIANP